MSAEANGSSHGAEDYWPTNILVTGGAGFIASHVAIRLVKKYGDYKVSREQISHETSVYFSLETLRELQARCRGITRP